MSSLSITCSLSFWKSHVVSVVEQYPSPIFIAATAPPRDGAPSIAFRCGAVRSTLARDCREPSITLARGCRATASGTARAAAVGRVSAPPSRTTTVLEQQRDAVIAELKSALHDGLLLDAARRQPVSGDSLRMGVRSHPAACMHRSWSIRSRANWGGTCVATQRRWRVNLRCGRC